MRPLLENSLQIGAHKVDEIFGKFRGNLLFGSVDEMEANMRLQHLTHQAINAPTDSGEQHKLSAALFIRGQRALDGVQLAAQFSHPLQQFCFFALMSRHRGSPLDNTHPRYSIY